MRLKSMLLLLPLLWATTLMAQKQKPAVEFTVEGLPTELATYINGQTSDSDRQKENAKTVSAFATVYKTLDWETQKRVTALYLYTVKAKMKASTEVSSITRVLTAYASVPGGGQNLAGWLDIADLFRKKSAKPKAIMEWVDFSERLLAERVLYRSNSSVWNFSATTPFRIGVEKDVALVWFDTPADLSYASAKDYNRIKQTRGYYNYKDCMWYGEGGRLEWSRTGLGAEACFAELGRYKAETKFPKFAADSVKFVHTHYFSQPILGRVEEHLSAQMEPSKYGYPRFRSYQRDFVIKDIMPEVDYSGSFMMNGAKFITASSKHPSSLIFKKDGKRVLSITSQKFTITTDRIVSENAAVALYVGNEDSIANTGITVRYSPTDRKVNLINDAKRNFYSPFIDTYHEMDIYSEIIVCNVATGVVEFGSLAATGVQSQALFESSNCYTYKKYREIQGIDEISPVRRVYDYASGGQWVFKASDFSNYIGFDMGQTMLMIHNLSRYGLVSYNELNGKVTVKEKLENYMKAFGRTKGFDYDALSLESSTKGSNATMSLDDNRLVLRGVERFVVSDSQRVVVHPRGGKVSVGYNRQLAFDGRIDVGRFVLFVSNGDFNYEANSFDLPQVDSLYFYVPKFNTPDSDHIVRTPLYNLVGSLRVDKPDNHCGLVKNKEFPEFSSTQNSYVYYDKRDICGGRYDRQRFYYTLHPFTLHSLVNFVTDSLQFNGVLTSGGIFPDITHPLTVQRDYYLGFKVSTPEGGYPAYGGKGTYHKTITLNHYGLKGEGNLTYLASTTRSRNILFLLDSMEATTDTFYLREEQGFPEVKGGRLAQRWHPYADSMAVATTAKGRPLTMYRGETAFNGRLDLQPKGASAAGKASVREGTIESQHFALHPREMNAETSTFTLRSAKFNHVAFTANGVRSHVDYVSHRAELTIPTGPARTELQLIKQEAYADQFAWDMNRKTLDITNSTRSSSEGMDAMDLRLRLKKHNDLPGVRFVSTDPDRQGLTYHSLHSLYRYEIGDLSSNGVFVVNVADAAIAPPADTLHIDRGGDVRQMANARLVFNRDSAWHYVERADIAIASAKQFTGSGYIDFLNDTERPQRLYLKDISVSTRGVTTAQGLISDSASFTLSSAFGFAGKVRYEGDHRWPWFEGGVRLLQPCIPKEQLGLLAYANYTDPDHVHIPVPENPTDWKGHRIAAAILMDKSNLSPHAAFLTSERVTNNELLSAHGVLTYLADKKQYMIGSKEKVSNPEAVVAPYLALSTLDCLVEGEGPVNFALKPTQASLYAYGSASVGIASSEQDHLATLFGFSFPIDKEIVANLADNLKNDLRLASATATTSPEMRHALIYHLGVEKGAAAYARYSATGKLDELPTPMQCSFLFDNVRWLYTPKVGLYYDGKVNLVAADGQPAGYQVKLKAQISKNGEAQQMTFYVEAAKDHWYFFRLDLASQELVVYSSSGDWLDRIKALPLDQRKIEKEGLGTFRYYVGNNSGDVADWLAWFSKTVYPADDDF